MVRLAAITALCVLTLSPAHAGNGDMFGDRGYAAAPPGTPPAHNTADMFPHEQGYVSTGHDMFGPRQRENLYGSDDMMSGRNPGPAPLSPLFGTSFSQQQR